MVTIAALLKRYGLVMSLPSIFLSDDRGFKVFFKMFFKKKKKKKKKQKKKNKCSCYNSCEKRVNDPMLK